MVPPPVKQCGHEGCLLQATESCCGCEDTRPIKASYTCYRDGKGVVKDSSRYARYWAYCPACKYQLMNLRKGKKRCACGLVRCDLTTEKCCICLDKRAKGDVCYKYVDGNGLIPLVGGKWIYYCPACQERAKPPLEPAKDPDTPSLPQDGVDATPPSTQNTPRGKEITTAEKTTRTVSALIDGIKIAPIPTTTLEPPAFEKVEPVEDSSTAYDDCDEYENINPNHLPTDEEYREEWRRKRPRSSWWSFATLR